MAKSKHKNKHIKRQKTPDLSRPRHTRLFVDPAHDSASNIRMMPPYEILPIRFCIKFDDGIPDFLSEDDVLRAKDLSFRRNDYTDKEINYAMEKMYQKIHNILTDYEKILSNYIEIHRDIDKKLNAFNISYPHDIIDFTEYNHDKLRTAAHMIQNADTSLLWSTDEYVEIIPSTYEKFILHRKNFDIEKNEISYEIAYYMHIQMHDQNIRMTMPLIFAEINTFIKKGTDIAMFQSESDEIKDTTVALYQLDKTSVPADICNFVLNNVGKYAHDEKDLDLYKSYIKLIVNQHMEMYVEHTNDKETAMQNMLTLFDQKISEALACIIITNQYIREKQLSTPVKNTEPKLTYTFTNHDKKQEYKAPPEMKIRILNGIKISSMRRPQSLSKERIITYQLSEWGRKEHLRHLKSGKVIPVKAATVHRKCVDAKNLAKQTTQTCTHYKIKDGKP